MGEKKNLGWSPESHRYFGENFKNRVKNFLLILKRNQKETRIKIPKFVLFEIIKRI